MNQSNVLMGALFVAFIIFITMRGKTKKYLDLLVGGGTSATAASDKAASSSSSGGGSGGTPGSGGSGGLTDWIPEGLKNMFSGITGLGSGSGSSDSSTPSTSSPDAPATFPLLGQEDVRFPSLPPQMTLPYYAKMARDSVSGFFSELPNYAEIGTSPPADFNSPVYQGGGAMYEGGSGAMYSGARPPLGLFSTSPFANPFFGGGAP